MAVAAQNAILTLASPWFHSTFRLVCWKKYRRRRRRSLTKTEDYSRRPATTAAVQPSRPGTAMTCRPPLQSPPPPFFLRRRSVSSSWLLPCTRRSMRFFVFFQWIRCDSLPGHRWPATADPLGESPSTSAASVARRPSTHVLLVSIPFVGIHVLASFFFFVDVAFF